MINPTLSMVVTRTVDNSGRVYLGKEAEGGDAGRARQRQLRVGSRLRGQRVDVRLDDGKLSVTTKGANGHDTVVSLGNRRNWTLTVEEFSRLPGVRTTTVSEPVSPQVTGAAEGHTGATVGCDPSEEAGTVIADRWPATAHPPTPAGKGSGGGDERDNGVVVAFVASPGPR